MNTQRMCSRFYCDDRGDRFYCDDRGDRFYCDDRGDRFCCADCRRYIICTNPCENHPSRCGLEDRTGGVRKQEVIKVKGG